MTISKINHSIKNRKETEANDIFITPQPLAKHAINMIDYKDDDIWFDPFKNSGSYYDQYPNNNKVYTEILEGKDFFEFDGKVDIICSNPPYSILNLVFKKSIALKPRVIQYLLGINNMTTKRIEMFEEAGYGLTKIHMCKVYKWFGMSCIFQFEKDKESIISYDRTIWK